MLLFWQSLAKTKKQQHKHTDFSAQKQQNGAWKTLFYKFTINFFFASRLNCNWYLPFCRKRWWQPTNKPFSYSYSFVSISFFACNTFCRLYLHCRYFVCLCPVHGELHLLLQLKTNNVNGSERVNETVFWYAVNVKYAGHSQFSKVVIAPNPNSVKRNGNFHSSLLICFHRSLLTLISIKIINWNRKYLLRWRWAIEPWKRSENQFCFFRT